jgi:acetoacetyl-CoA reductase
MTALITGGTGAIGSAIARCFAKQGILPLVLNCSPADAERSRAVCDELASDGLPVHLQVFDVTDDSAAADAVADIEEKVGPIQVLVNAAGITRDAKLVDLDHDSWHSVIDINLNGVYNVTRPVVKAMTARRYGRIINISSVNGQRGQIGQTNYSAAKAGMTGFTKALAREVARDGITVNSVSPGYVRSPMTDSIPDRIKDKLIGEIPVGRAAEPEEIGRVVAFLADPESGYITGTDVSVNGGYYI